MNQAKKILDAGKWEYRRVEPFKQS
jgi:hypothetical protein